MKQRFHKLIKGIGVGIVICIPMLILSYSYFNVIYFLLLMCIVMLSAVLYIYILNTQSKFYSNFLHSMRYMHRVYSYFCIFLVIQSGLLRKFPAIFPIALVLTAMFVLLSLYIVFKEYSKMNYIVLFLHIISIFVSILLLFL